MTPPGELEAHKLAFPDPAVCEEPRLFAHLHGGAAFEGGGVSFTPGSGARFETYYNALNLDVWTRRARLDRLRVDLSGIGEIELCAMRRCLSTGRRQRLGATKRLTLSDRACVDLSHALPQRGLLWLEIRAVGEAYLSEGAFLVPRRGAAPDLVVSITTFRREAEVAATARRLNEFLDGYAEGRCVRVVIVDNGRTVDAVDVPGATLLPNPNLGGAGGFARGLAHAVDTGATHVLFMDDDASFLMESLRRTYAFLHLARDPAASVAGAMISTARPDLMWENAATFWRRCRPRAHGLDLSDPDALWQMEARAVEELPANAYGGWWFFAFPVAAVKHFPFPFFVRGDDSSFSLAHDFSITTLGGVASFQEDFPAKESPLVHYLDLRYHVVHHLAFPYMRIGALRTATIAMWFLMRSVVRFHYESAEAQLRAWSDLMEGPQMFARNADMAAKRAEISALRQRETWKRIDAVGPTAQPPRALSPVLQRVMALTLNGHLLPFYRLFARHATVPTAQRGPLWPVWGACRITWLDRQGTHGYVTELRPAAFMLIMIRMSWLLVRFLAAYRRLLRDYQSRYPEMTSRDFWQKHFLDEAAEDAASPAIERERARA